MTDTEDRPRSGSGVRSGYVAESYDTGGHGTISGGEAMGLQVMDKRIIISALQQRAKLLRSQAEGIDRLAQLVGAASDHDYALFATLSAIIK